MAMTRDQILAEVSTLPAKERAELAEDIRQIADDDEFTEEQHAELRRRLDAIDRGEVTWIPGDEAFRRVREMLRKR